MPPRESGRFPLDKTCIVKYLTGVSERKRKKAKKRMGRPPLPAAKRRSVFLAVRCTPGEYAELKRDAKAKGMSMGRMLIDAWRRTR